VGDDAPADELSHLGNYGVPETLESVHPSGNPMSHSTHGGFNGPPACTAKGGVFLSSKAGEVPLSLQSRAQGVGSRLLFTAVASPSPEEGERPALL
jgi:hypothetical protein